MDKQDSKRLPPLTPGTTSVMEPVMNRKMRRAMKYGHVLKPEFDQAGYKQRVQREGKR